MTKNILLVEDDAFKAKKIGSFIANNFPQLHFIHEKSVTTGLARLMSDSVILLLLDMSLSTYDVGPRESGGRPQNFGGITVFDHMARRKLTTPVIVITQFPGFKRDNGEDVSLDALRKELCDKFPDNYKALLSYSSGDRQWEHDLNSWITNLLGGN